MEKVNEKRGLITTRTINGGRKEVGKRRQEIKREYRMEINAGGCGQGGVRAGGFLVRYKGGRC